MKKVDFWPFFRFFAIFTGFFGRIYHSDYENIMRKNFLYIFPQKKSREKIFFHKKKFFFNPIFRIFRHLSIFNAELVALVLRLSAVNYAKPIATNVFFPTSGQTSQTKNFTMKKNFPPWIVLLRFFQIFPNLGLFWIIHAHGESVSLKTHSRTSTFSALFSKNRGKKPLKPILSKFLSDFAQQPIHILKAGDQ